MKEFKYKVFASAGPEPKQLKEKVDLSNPCELIYYQSRVYAIRYKELRNIGLDYFDEIVSMCQERGLEDPAFFGRACFYCANSTTNLEDLVELSSEPFIIENPNKVNCTYRPKKDIRVAVTYTSKDKKQKPFYAVNSKRCVFDDCLISYLADNSLLDPYRVDIPFNFKPVTDFSLEDKIPSEYLSKNVEKSLPESARRKSKGFSVFRLIRKFLR